MYGTDITDRCVDADTQRYTGEERIQLELQKDGSIKSVTYRRLTLAAHAMLVINSGAAEEDCAALRKRLYMSQLPPPTKFTAPLSAKERRERARLQHATKSAAG